MFCFYVVIIPFYLLSEISQSKHIYFILKNGRSEIFIYVPDYRKKMYFAFKNTFEYFKRILTSNIVNVIFFFNYTKPYKRIDF